MSFTHKYIISLLEDIIKDIKNNECSEEELIDSLAKFNPETKGYIKEEDYVNADKAMRILKLGYNRNKFFSITNKIFSYTTIFSNMLKENRMSFFINIKINC